ncbi:MAG: TraR/DksA C4-type zinc finger protein, partial [Kiritimatiellaeota bacterium]|nr:TraR/DksA C4-type zinc finger protein [Kiritimatiellota bacterium]
NKAPLSVMFKKADEVLYSAVKGISDLIMKPGLINRDFADVKTVMSASGLAMMGSGSATGESRARDAAMRAITSPLLEDVSIDGARRVLVNITADPNLTLEEVTEAMSAIQGVAHNQAHILFGTALDEDAGDEIRITVIATGIDSDTPKTTNPPPQPPKPPAAPNTPGNGFLVIRPFSRTAEAKKAAEEKQPSKQAKLSATELRRTRDELVAMRNRLTAKAHVMRRVALERNDEINTEEDGIDQFDRLFEIEKIASVQEFVYLIDEALHALDEGVYGVCQKCGGAIEKARIQALPFAKACIHCQNEAERMKARA